MKKTVTLFLAILSIIVVSAALTACGGEPDGGSTSYGITYEAGDDYKITGLKSEAEAGATVNFDVESASVFYEVGKVTMNGAELTRDMFGYTFTMPAEDVKIAVSMTHVGEYDDPDDHLEWGSSVTGQISLAEGDTARINLNFDGISSANWITDIKETIYSSDENVIPTDAVEFVPTKASASSAIIGGYLSVDLTNAHEGETYIYLELDPNNSSLGKLIRKFTVISTPVEYETLDVTFTYDNRTDYAEKDILLNITDNDTNELESIWLNDFEDGKLTFEYKKGHTYTVTCSYWEENNGTGLYIDEWVGTNEGGAVNTLERDNKYPARNTLTLTSDGIEVPLVIDDSEY